MPSSAEGLAGIIRVAETLSLSALRLRPKHQKMCTAPNIQMLTSLLSLN